MSGATSAVRAGLGAFAALAWTLAALGARGWLRPAGAAAAAAVLAALGAGALALRGAGARGVPRAPAAPWRPVEAALAAAIATAFATRAWAGLHKTTFLYDTLSYHLHVPAAWMHSGRLEIVPAVFGDPAPAYAPASFELWLWLLMAPLRSDYLAAAGQLPLAALAVAAIAAAVRELGGGRAPALAAGLAFLLVPEVFQQAPTAMADVAMAAFFLAALPFLIRMGGARGADAGDAAAAGIALGLCAGTKVTGLVLGAPLAAAAAVLLLRARAPRPAALCAGAALAAGGVWYLRNLVVTGNPLYPAAVAIGPVTLFAGLTSTAAMRASEYHLPAGDLAALGAMLLEAGVGFVVGAAAALASARRPPWGLLVLALVALFWLVIPYQESRFLFPAYGVAAIALGQAGALRWWPLAAALAGAIIQFPTAERLAIAAAAPLGPVALALARALRARLRWQARVRFTAAAAAAALAVAVAAVALHAGLRAYRARDPGYTVGDELAAAWSWLRAGARGARVAYTGNNLPFPLAGADLANQVRYVNVAGGPDARAHDFPARAPGRRDAGPEPAPYRDGACFETWLANLRAARSDVLFVAALYPSVRRTIDGDSDGFPIERAWADAHPALFRLRHASPAARVYQILPDAHGAHGADNEARP